MKVCEAVSPRIVTVKPATPLGDAMRTDEEAATVAGHAA